jgi:hypothetical protein
MTFVRRYYKNELPVGYLTAPHRLPIIPLVCSTYSSYTSEAQYTPVNLAPSYLTGLLNTFGSTLNET